MRLKRKQSVHSSVHHSPSPGVHKSDHILTVHDGEEFVLPSKYRIERTIGTGAYGHVVSAVDMETNKPVAIKKNKNIYPIGDDECTAGVTSCGERIVPQTRSCMSQMRVLREVKIMKHCCTTHPSVVRILDIISPESYDSFSDVYIVMELLDADLRDLLDGPALISNEHIKYIMYQLLHAVRHLHAASITHRDIKPENILLNEDGQVKLCDFGLARGCNFLEVNNTARFSNNYVQTRYYRAPELLLDCDLVGTGVDIWSVGCIFGEMLGGGGILFTGSSSANQLKKIIRTMGTPSMDEVGSEKGRFFVNSLDYVEKNEEWYFDVLPRHCVDMYALDLLCKLLAFDPKKRITAEQALRHPYFRNIDLDIKPVQISKFCFDYEKSLFVANTQDEERFASLCKRECYETIVGFHKRSGDKRQLSTKKSFKQTLRELFKTKK